MLFRVFCLWLVVVSIPAAVPIRIKIACVGDSITQGAGLAVPDVESYPARLQVLLGTKDYNVYNFGLGGRTLLKRGDLPYWNEQAFIDSRTFAPDIVIIQLGTNDSKPQNWQYGNNFTADYKAMIAIYAALPSAPQIYLCTPCPAFSSSEINAGIIHNNIAPQVRQIAADLSLPVIDLHVHMTNSLWFPDTIHPNSRGMAVMTGAMFEGLFGAPEEPVPAPIFERISPTRIVLSWPAKWGGLIPSSAIALKNSATAWTLLETTPPRTDGVWIRQTNNISSAARFFQLQRP